MISSEEFSVLLEIQKLPLVSKPYLKIAKKLNMKENHVMKICQSLIDRGIIKRFGISINHRKIGVRANLMVAANVPVSQIDEFGEKVAGFKRVTHCYYREGWKYNLFFMIHSDSKSEVLKLANKIIDKVGIKDYKFIFSTKEFKKTSFEISKLMNINQKDKKNFQNECQLPLVLKLNGPIIIFGGGNVGKRKLDYISQFTTNITVVGDKVKDLPNFVQTYNIKLSGKEFSKYIPDTTSLVVAALSNSEINKRISYYCISKKILINVVDNPTISTVIFPALTKKGDLNIAISTRGKCPFLSKRLRIHLDTIKDYWADWLEILAPYRKSLIGKKKKNKILSEIYENPEIKNHIKNKDIKKAKRKAEEIFNAFSKY